MTAMVFLSVREAANQRAESSTVYFCISFAQITIDSSSSSRISEKRTFSLFFSLSLSLFLSLGPYFFLKILSLWPSFISSKFFFPFCPEFIWRTHETKSMIVTISLLDSISPQISPRFFSLDSSLASISLTQTEHECSFHRKRKKKKKIESFHRNDTLSPFLFYFSFVYRYPVERIVRYR